MTNIILSAYVANNAEVFANILDLHIPARTTIIDVTFGKGSFWGEVEPGVYNVVAFDISPEKKIPARLKKIVSKLTTGIDCRRLPFKNNSIRCIVFDPPYMSGFFRPENRQLPGSVIDSMGVNDRFSTGESIDEYHHYHKAVVNLYVRGGLESYRVLKNNGHLIVKCQDEVASSAQRLTHVEIISAFESMGYYAKDLFVVVRKTAPTIQEGKIQKHARKNHSYIIVFQKKKTLVRNVVHIRKKPRR